MYGISLKPKKGTPKYLVMLLDWMAIDGRLRGVFLELAEYLMQKYGIGIVLTCLIRSAEENKAVGGSSTSAHRDGEGRAGDLRSRSFTPEQITDIEDHLVQTWGTDFLYVLVHDSGRGPHIHINIRWQHRRGSHQRPQKGTEHGTT